ncbi:MAG: hypothetical protein OEW15_04875 [Nitrospirota bacterium]|nr:hypothetical protein [Nitrospirota bacterium]
MKIVIFCIITTMFFSGCASKRTFTQDEWTRITTREYSGRSATEVFDAIEKVLRLADESDVKIYRWPDRLIATRSYLIYAVLAATNGLYTFDIHTVPGESGTKVVAIITLTAGTIAGAPTAYNPTIITTPSAGGMVMDNPETYDLFFSRVKYFLNGGVWVTCERATEMYRDSPSGALDGLCLMSDDDLPEEMRQSTEGNNSWRSRRARR